MRAQNIVLHVSAYAAASGVGYYFSIINSMGSIY